MSSSRPMRLSPLSLRFALSIACISTACAQPPQPAAVGKHAPVAAHASRVARRAARKQLPLPPVTPARVALVNGQLSVDAQNSDLTQILQEVARITGMSISGLQGGPRVFGAYGPGDPRTVLTGLLTASGYNFMLLGGNDLPRELLLTRETKAPPSVAHDRKPQPRDDDDEYAALQSPAPNR